MRYRNQQVLLIFGKHLKELRSLKEITQEALAYKADISLSQIARIETGRLNPTLCTLVLIADALDIELSSLLDFKAG